jgi:hypothetical protein
VALRSRNPVHPFAVARLMLAPLEIAETNLVELLRQCLLRGIATK